MEQDPTKLGTMKLMGTFGVPSYISFGDDYMKKIRAGSAARRTPHAAPPPRPRPAATQHLLPLVSNA